VNEPVPVPEMNKMFHIFDVCINLKLIENARYSQGRELLVRLVAMLTKMRAVQIKSGSGTGSGSFTIFDLWVRIRMCRVHIFLQVFYPSVFALILLIGNTCDDVFLHHNVLIDVSSL
jgi:hypothetical protein